MKAVVQRVKKAQVSVEDEIVGRIGPGLLVLLAVSKEDEQSVIAKMAEKIVNLRIFADNNDKMNLSLLDTGGEILVVSQFTLYGDCQKGNRPGFSQAAQAEKARDYYHQFIKYLKDKGAEVQTGKFGAKMQVELINDGPVTFVIEI